jgi:hypothetical protein
MKSIENFRNTKGALSQGHPFVFVRGINTKREFFDHELHK